MTVREFDSDNWRGVALTAGTDMLIYVANKEFLEAWFNPDPPPYPLWGVWSLDRCGDRTNNMDEIWEKVA